MSNKFFINLYLALLIFSSLAAIELPGPIVDVKWLKENISDVQVVNVRVDLDNLYSEPKFNQDPVSGKKTVVQVGGHIENSYVLDYRGARDSRIIGGKEAQFLIPVKEKFIDYVQSAGINRDKPIVIVAKGDSAPDIFRALRVFWEFKVYGQDDVVFLDGGMAAWLSESMPYVTKKTAKDRGSWTVSAFNASLIASTDEVKKLSDSRSSKKDQVNLSLENLLLDARAPSQFYGIAKRPYISKYGHIPGAINYSPDLICYVSNQVYYLLKEETYKAIFEQMSLDFTNESIVYCNTGEMAAGLWFILTQIFKNQSVKLYDGSFWLWLHQDMPIESVPFDYAQLSK